MANFNSNSWYQLHVNENVAWSLYGTDLFNDGRTGSVFHKRTNATAKTQRWQIFSVNSTTYVLRCQEGGPSAFLGVFYTRHEDTAGQTRALMVKNTIADESVLWTVTPWGDGTFYLTNGSNGTAWHLLKKPTDGLLAMSSDINDIPNGQRWTFNAIQKIESINNYQYSTVNLPFATTSSAASATITTTATAPPAATSPSSASDSNTPSRSGSLSTGAKAGIGASVGCVLVIALIVGCLWLLRRRKQHAPYVEKMDDRNSSHEMAHETVKYEMYHNGSVKHEMPGRTEQEPVELPNNAVASSA